MSDGLAMPMALARDANELARAIITRHGGDAAMTAVDYEIVAGMVRVFNAMRAAAPADLPKLIDSLSKLDGMLGLSPGKSERSPLERLHDHCAAHAGASDGDGRGLPTPGVASLTGGHPTSVAGAS